jgi:hypothetical protein
MALPTRREALAIKGAVEELMADVLDNDWDMRKLPDGTLEEPPRCIDCGWVVPAAFGGVMIDDEGRCSRCALGAVLEVSA